MRFVAIVLLLILQALAQTRDPTADYSGIVDANTRFALKLVRARAAGIKENELFSPIALSSGFALLQNGANPRCANDIGSAFEFGRIPVDNLNRAYDALLKYLPSRPSTPLAPGKKQTAPPNGLYLANSFWVFSGAFSHDFLAVNQSFYRAEVPHVRSRQDAGAAINSWAKKQSFGRAIGVVGSVAKDDFLFTSLLYFHARWEHQFLAAETHDADFALLSGNKKKVRMMKEAGHFFYEHTADFEAIVLPYSDQRRLYIFLPDEKSSLKDFEATLTAENWTRSTESLSMQAGTIELPRFRLSARADLKEELTQLGAGCAFASFAAFSPAVPRVGAKLTHVRQELSFATDEQGSEAVVYTGIGGVIGGVPGGRYGPPPPPPFHMVVNRPFFAAIVDAHTGAMVLVASVVDP